MAHVHEITVWTRGVVKDKEGRDVANGIARAADREGKFTQAFDNYVDLPDRVNVPVRKYARISEDEIEMRYEYENDRPEVVVLVDEDYCVGCRYCIQACPYGARWFHPTKHVASKCTLCYHRIVKGKVPACVEACPTGARIFGEVEDRSTPLSRFMRANDIQVLKPHMNTEPKVYYANLDGEVR